MKQYRINNEGITMSKINELNTEQVKELVALFQTESKSNSLNEMIGEKVIIRTHSAGVFFGELKKKSGNEVILNNARRMWRWKSAKSVSLSGVAVHGINQGKSCIAPAVSSVWLQAIEIISCSDRSIKSIEGAEDVEAK